MYRGPSPIFDVPEFPPLRRVKPLPKRRRTSTDQTFTTSHYAQVEGMIPSDVPVNMSPFGLNMPLPQYYLPIFNGVQDLFRVSTEDRSLQYPGGFAVPIGSADEDDHGDGDYVDHLQQPGNTKKRKVPAAHHSTMDPLSSPITTGDDASDERPHSMAIPGRIDDIEADVGSPAFAVATPPSVYRRKNKSSAATLAGLQHKELLKTRKRQLAAVLGALSHGDTLALDQALSARYSAVASIPVQHKTEGKENNPGGRPYRRSNKHKSSGKVLLSAPDPLRSAPTCDFTFACPSPTSKRLISTREEVAVLHSRFEAELSRQATKAVEVAKQSALTAENGLVAKRGDRTQQRSRTTGALTPSGFDSASGTGAKSRTSKKKKRSALANASNPHHLRNYVPSRSPHSGLPATNHGAVNARDLISPAPIRFLSAEIAPRRGKKSATLPAPSMPTLNHPEDEWICAFCEYNLFYGGDVAFRRAVRSRKKILGRRRRARERAAAAGSGRKNNTPVDHPMTTTDSFDTHVEEEHVAGDMDGNRDGPAKRASSASKRDRDK